MHARWEGDAESLSLKSLEQGLSSALPGAAQGATMGAAAGPWGALVGGLAGGALGASQRPARAPRRAPAAAPVPQVAGGAAAAPASTPPANAAGQLAALLQNPQVLQLLTSLTAGGGSPAPVATAVGAVPAGAVLNAVSELAGRAAAQTESVGDDSYLRGPDGRFRCDPTVPAERADVVYGLLAGEPEADGLSGAAAPLAWLLSSQVARIP